MAKKPYQNKAWLDDMYNKQGKTVTEIADYLTEMGVPTSHMTIFNWLQKFELMKKSRNLGPRSNRDGTGKKGGYY